MNKIFTYNERKNQILLGIKVKANAKKNSIGKFIEVNRKSYLKINISETPQQGEANIAIIKFLSDEWKVPKDNISILIGFTSSFKILAISNVNYEYLSIVLSKYTQIELLNNKI